MKKLELKQMENLEGGMNWKNFTDGACLATALFPNIYTTGACIVWGFGRMTDKW